MDCPYCGESIKDLATVCRFCQRDLFFMKPLLEAIRLHQDRIENLEEAIRSLLASHSTLGPAAIRKQNSNFRSDVIKCGLGAAFYVALYVAAKIGEFEYITPPWLISGMLGALIVTGFSVGVSRAGSDIFSYARFGFLTSGIALLMTLLSAHWLGVSMTLSDDAPITLPFLVGGALGFVAGATTGDFIERRKRARSDVQDYSERWALKLFGAPAGRDPAKNQVRVQTFAQIIAALAPVFALVGSIATAYIGAQKVAEKTSSPTVREAK